MNTKINDLEYINMCKLMIDSDEELKIQLSDSKVQEILNSEVWLFFGPSKAGKSTLLARIKSLTNCEDFMKFVELSKNSGDKAVSLDEIQVRYSGQAMTTVPNFFVKKKAVLIDLAGFVDPSTRREPVISLLNNSLFSRLRKCKILIVLDLSSLVNPNMHYPVYVKELEKLLTDSNFNLGVESCACIITKVDIFSEMIVKEFPNRHNMVLNPEYVVEQLMMKHAAQMQTSSPKVAKLVGSLSQHHCLVDYRVDDSEATHTRIFDMMSSVKELETSLLKFDVITASNRLNDESVELMNYLESEFKGIENKISNTKKNEKDEWTQTNIKCKNALQEIESNLHSIDSSNELLVFYKRRNIEIADKIDKNQQDIETHHKDITQVESQKVDFHSKIENFRILWLNPIISTKREGLATGWGIRGEFPKPAGAVTDLRVVIYKTEDYKLKENDILSCPSVVDFDNLKGRLPCVYDNGAYMQMNIVDINVKKLGNGFIAIHTDSKLSHVVLLLVDVKINDTTMKPLTSTYFQNYIDKMTKEIQEKKIEIQKAMDEKQHMDKDTINQQTIVDTCKSKADASRILLENLKNDFKKNQDSRIMEFQNIYSRLRDIKSDIVLKHMEKLSQILIANKMLMTSYKRVPGIRTNIESLLGAEISTLNSLNDHTSQIFGYNNIIKTRPVTPILRL